MRWSAQVVHVVRKDLRPLRWLLLTYVLLAALVTAAVLAWQRAEAVPGWPQTIGLTLLGMLLFALLVQADAPARSDAFWATLPLERSAVLAAKLLSGSLLLLAVPLLGQLAGLSAFEVSPEHLPALLGHSALAYGAWLAAAAAVAALTPDLRSFVAAFAVVMLAWQVGGSLVRAVVDPGHPPGTVPPIVAGTVVVGGALLVMAHQYLTRDTRRGVRIAVAAGLLVLALPALASRPDPSVAAAPGAVPEELRPAGLAVRHFDLRSVGKLSASVTLRGGAPFHQYLLASPTATVDLPGDSVLRLEMRIDPYRGLTDPVPDLGEGVRWLDRPDRPRVTGYGLSFDLTADQRAALAGGIEGLAVQGRLEVQEARVRAELPLEPGAAAASGGHRLRVLGVERFGGAPMVEVEYSYVAAPGERGRFEPSPIFVSGAPWFVLVNRERGEAVALDVGGSSGSGGSLVLPGVNAETSRLRLVTDQRLGEPPEIGPDWLRQAELLFVEWAPLGSEPVRAEAAVASLPGGPRRPSAETEQAVILLRR